MDKRMFFFTEAVPWLFQEICSDAIRCQLQSEIHIVLYHKTDSKFPTNGGFVAPVLRGVIRKIYGSKYLGKMSFEPDQCSCF